MPLCPGHACPPSVPGPNPARAGLADWISRGCGSIHMMGLCGVGMAGLAVLLKARGFKVSGCDTDTAALGNWLKQNGIEVLSGHDPLHIAGKPDLLIRSPAVREGHPEVATAQAAGVPCCKRGEILPVVAGLQRSIAVAGTHGKTSTSAMVAWILESAGLRPGFCIGGIVDQLGGGTARAGKDWLVLEADESDGTLIHYHPEVALVTNIEFDHMEHFASDEQFFDCFSRFVRQAQGSVVYCGDDPGAARVMAGIPGAVSYGFGPDVDFQLVRPIHNPSGSCADVMVHDASNRMNVVGSPVPGRFTSNNPPGTADATTLANDSEGKLIGSLVLQVPGNHYLLNALGACLASVQAGVSLEYGLKFVRGFQPPRRRFETIFERGGIRIVSDYAHHPTEIRAVMHTALQVPCQRRIAIYQPHRYTRTLALGADFPPAFDGLDQLILVPVYAASEEPIPGGTSEDLFSRFSNRNVPVELAGSLDQGIEQLASMIRPGDLVLILGAGDVEKACSRLKDRLEAGWAGEV